VILPVVVIAGTGLAALEGSGNFFEELGGLILGLGVAWLARCAVVLREGGGGEYFTTLTGYFVISTYVVHLYSDLGSLSFDR